ncbi:hypothetical protein EBY67_01345 [bacterium]|nr:hypothetical protein [bacterium]
MSQRSKLKLQLITFHSRFCLCGYLFETAGMFHRFFEACPVLQAPSPELRNSRLTLAGLAGDILRDGLGILGIPTLEEM